LPGGETVLRDVARPGKAIARVSRRPLNHEKRPNGPKYEVVSQAAEPLTADTFVFAGHQGAVIYDSPRVSPGGTALQFKYD
jgi:hypothetical protein